MPFRQHDAWFASNKALELSNLCPVIGSWCAQLARLPRSKWPSFDRTAWQLVYYLYVNISLVLQEIRLPGSISLSRTWPEMLTEYRHEYSLGAKLEIVGAQLLFCLNWSALKDNFNITANITICNLLSNFPETFIDSGKMTAIFHIRSMKKPNTSLTYRTFITKHFV